MGITADVIFAILVFEHWLGHQKWINARSIIALVILVFIVVGTLNWKHFLRGK